MTVRARLVGRRRTALATVWQSSLPPVAGGLAFPRPLNQNQLQLAECVDLDPIHWPTAMRGPAWVSVDGRAPSNLAPTLGLSKPLCHSHVWHSSDHSPIRVTSEIAAYRASGEAAMSRVT